MKGGIFLDFGIRGKVALVTGGLQGIGFATASALADEGTNVCIADANEELAAQVIQALERKGVSAMFVKTDVSSVEDVKHLFAVTAEKLGSVSILVNNAAISPKCSFDQIPADQFSKVMDVNLLGTYLCSQQAFEHMKTGQWGRIINLSSSTGLYGASIAGVHYAATKGGIISLTKTLARTMGPYRITVNCVAPARINTPLVRSAAAEANEAFRQKIPLRRFGKPEEVGSVIAFLASEPAGYVTGACVEISGGYVG